jgi:hypothetical protein
MGIDMPFQNGWSLHAQVFDELLESRFGASNITIIDYVEDS